jgi:hypothetical protein
VHIDASTPVSTKIFVRRAASRQLTVGTWLVVLALEIFAANGEVLRRQPNATLKMPLTAPEPGFTSELAFNDRTFLPGGRGEVQIEDPDASGRQKYYRLRIIPSANHSL